MASKTFATRTATLDRLPALLLARVGRVGPADPLRPAFPEPLYEAERRVPSAPNYQPSTCPRRSCRNYNERGICAMPGTA